MSNGQKKNIQRIRKILLFGVTIAALVLAFLWAVNTGSIHISFRQLFRGLFVEYDDMVATVYDLRFPRIIIAMLVGAALSVSGVLLQAVLKNPLTDPGIIGISGGASFAAVLVMVLVPNAYYAAPIAALIGGLAAFFLVYTLAWKDGSSPLRIILVGVAVSTMFTGLSSALNSMQGGNLSGAAAIVNGNITMKTWTDVHMVLYYIPIGLIISLFFARQCNLMALDDKTARGIGVNVNRARLIISLIAVMLASISTAVAGIISFVGLIVPHMARIAVGNNHKLLLPYSMILGALILLLADTIGRTIAQPYEVSASVIMSIAGGPFFIILLRRRRRYGG